VDLVIAETATSTWNYHLREVKDGKLYPGGAAPPALCGKQLGWDTKIPLESWKISTIGAESWCTDCDRLRKRQR
jgi:hypothetical protein